MTIALYRKYRPKTLDELLGQEQVTRILKQSAASSKLGHAYLFFGPRGSGKTTAARLIAKLACCLTRRDDAKFRLKGEPCNTCQACDEIDAGRGVDVIEIDAASNTGVENVRDIIEGVRLAPSSYPYKVIIFDEVHMLSKGAFNALLKTLEEPPAHALFVLATTEFDKVPATIASRAQRFHFRKLPLDIIIGKLKAIVKTEKFKIDEDAIELIAALGEGSFRDAESLLSQVTALAEKVTLQTVEEHLGTVGYARVIQLADKILTNDLKSSLAYINELNAGGHNVVDVSKELIHYLRRVLTLKYNPDLEVLFKRELTTKELEQIKSHAKQFNDQKHIPLLKALIAAYAQMRYSPFAAIPLEVALIEHMKTAV
jgi:DNA polymerase III subunit gamma/tau